MGYQIEYPKIGKLPKAQKKSRTSMIAAILVLVLVAGALTVKTTGLTWVKEELLPGDPAVTAAALEGIAEELRNGGSLRNAIKAFCEEIVGHGLEAE